MEPEQETSNIEQLTTTEPKWIPVEELADYYARTKPPGRKYPVQSQLDFEDLYIDESRGEVQNSGLEAVNRKQSTKSIKKISNKSSATSRSKVEAKEDSVVQSTSKSIQGNGKGKMGEGENSEEDEEESDEDDEKREEHQAKDLNDKKYKSCDTCTWARVRCVAGKNTNADGDKICLECEKRGRDCHFSIKGQRPAGQPRA